MKLDLKGKLLMAPLAGFTDLAFRELVAGLGSYLNFTEMISLKGLYYGDKHTQKMLETAASERCFVQVFGHDLETIPKAVKQLNQREDILGIDFNLGCPAPKIVNNGDGSALMARPDDFARLLRSLVHHAEKPVSVKFRLGFTDDQQNFLQIGQIAQEEGAAFVTLHPRTRTQFYRGQADWSKIKELKDHLTIPVVGNGDVLEPGHIQEMFEKTGCDAIALGRGALANPFLFQQRQAQPQELYGLIRQHYEKKLAYLGKYQGIRQMRKQVAYYLKGGPGAAGLRKKIQELDSLEEILPLLEGYFLDRSA